ncbi:1-deoxy-D-xylulose-5-phosphate synthase [Calidifontibacter sp. DB0510]|uniref:1-deoxy-D-xylulose-5-phosphate synthase n=1 Tax=Metallococcus carri TaxID=1656884 RepID=A0A967EB42_9MICO|nr:1-deoxy-D-xylulose-5-phosphate synthase [Metallococcus carri]NHN56910.1 1-deoxy-D-xylulose-5-phosphate synthase [Metallococcus carri]NOP37655.1 1-deoxy-D-xylulose-5-phosphate synthase [Calidifontibacter sp. DB2511S]
MGLLARIAGPSDVKKVPVEDLDALAQEIREFLVQAVSKTGGHLGPNLGVVELTIAMHRVFNSPHDTLVFDTGHQSYVHKLLTGRQDFSKLKKQGGLSGYPSRAESKHDVVESSHASVSLSWAHGIAKARRVAGENDRHTVAVIGDGALTGGMAWEALNNIAVDKDLPLVIVVNDNERSYAPTIGGLAEHLAVLRTTRQYEKVLGWGKSRLKQTPVVGNAAYGTLHGVKKGIKDIIAPQEGMFEDLGLKYLGPVDGHDEQAVEHALQRARDFGGPCLVHVITEKGRGYQPALDDIADRMHGIGKINPETGLPFEVSGRIWTDEFAEEMVRLGAERPDIVAVTAAMLIPVGLDKFAEAYPDRVVDVGIAEQHAVTMASGMSYAGLHPVVAVYSTFLNRAFDQLLMDCALHQQGVTFVLDRAGITGSDGPSHNGMWDMAICSIVPGLRLAAPRDGEQVKAQLREAVEVDDAPTVIRFPKGDVGDPLLAVRREGAVDVLRDSDDPEVLIVAVGAMAPLALDAADKIEAQGHSVMVVDPRWVLPVSPDLVHLARRARHCVVVEDNLVEGGIGSAVVHALREDGQFQPVHCFGVPKTFPEHASRSQVLEQIGLTADVVSTEVSRRLGPIA